MPRTLCKQCENPLDGAHKVYCKACFAAYVRNRYCPTGNSPGRPAEILYIINSKTGCWDWQGSCSWTGYARIKRNGRLIWAHRHYYEEKYGPLPPHEDGWELDHLCRNKKCVNPDHLEVVSIAENQRRGLAVKLSWDAVEDVRSNYIPYSPEYGQRAFARKYGVTHSAIQHVINNISWQDKPAVFRR